MAKLLLVLQGVAKAHIAKLFKVWLKILTEIYLL